MNVYLVGNASVSWDNVPQRLLTRLRKRLPELSFSEADPNENFVPVDGSIIIDTVLGIHKPVWFTDISAFEQTRSVSPHDYDLGLHLKLLLKLHKINRIRILGVGTDTSLEDVVSEIERHILSEKQSKNHRLYGCARYDNDGRRCIFSLK